MNKLYNKKIILIISIILILIMILSTTAFAINTGNYDPHATVGSTGGAFQNKAGKILGWIRFIGTIISIVTIAFIGLKYMLGSLEEKAEYKKTALTYIVGCIILLSGSQFLGLFEGLMKSDYNKIYYDSNGQVKYFECTSCGWHYPSQPANGCSNCKGTSFSEKRN